MAREHKKEYESDEYEHTALYEGFDNVREDSMKYALNETLKEVKPEKFEGDRERLDLLGIQANKFRLSIFETFY